MFEFVEFVVFFIQDLYGVSASQLWFGRTQTYMV